MPSTESRFKLLAVRREKLQALKERGVEPYGGQYMTTHAPGELFENFAEGLQVSVAGRISAWRDMGKTQFFDLSDIHGRIQCFMNAKVTPEAVSGLFKDCLDLGDWVGVKGETFITKTGEPSIKVVEISGKNIQRPFKEQCAIPEECWQIRNQF